MARPRSLLLMLSFGMNAVQQLPFYYDGSTGLTAWERPPTLPNLTANLEIDERRASRTNHLLRGKQLSREQRSEDKYRGKVPRVHHHDGGGVSDEVGHAQERPRFSRNNRIEVEKAPKIRDEVKRKARPTFNQPSCCDPTLLSCAGTRYQLAVIQISKQRSKS